MCIFYNQKQKLSGFTLIEVLVSLSLFAVVATMAVGTLLVLVNANSKQQNIQSVVTNMSFALDSMTREIRTGQFFECKSQSSQLTKSNPPSGSTIQQDCTGSGYSNFAFTESGGSLTNTFDSSRIAYRFNSINSSIERRLGNPSTDGVDWRAITAPEVHVDTLRFIVTDTAPGDTKSPTVTIFVSGRAGHMIGTDSSFNLEATVTQHLLDI